MLTTNSGVRSLAFAALTATITCGTMLNAQAQVGNRTVLLDAGSVIPVKLDNELSSNNSRKGDTFTVTLRNDNDAEYYRLPTGTHIEGVIRDVRPKRDKEPGLLDLDFRRLRMPDGRSYAIQGSLIGLDNKSVEKRSDGRLVAKPGHSNDRLTYVGYGAGAGLIAGLLTKHTLEDTAIGGGLGYLFGSLSKGQTQTKDVDLKPGSELGVRLDQGVTLASAGGRDDYNNYRAKTDDTGRFHRDGATAGANGSDVNRNVNSGDKGYRQDDTNRQTGRDNGPDRNIDQGNRNNTNDPGRPGRLDADRQGQNRQDDRSIDKGGDSSIGVLVGDRNVRFDSAARPFSSNGVIMVPLRNVLNRANIPFTFDADSKTIRVTTEGGRAVRLALGSSIAVVNGDRRVRLDAPAQQLNGMTYVPVKFFSVITGREATYDAPSRTVQINIKSAGGDPRPNP